MLVWMKLDPQRGGVENNVIHKTKSLKLLVHEGNGGVYADTDMLIQIC